MRLLLKRILISWLIITALVALLGKVSIAQSNAGQTAAEFLHIGLGARAAGMGGAYTALADGTDAVYWNPGGMVANLHGGEVTFGHFSWFQGISVEHGAFAYQVDDQSAIGVGLTYVNYGTINKYDINGNVNGELSVYDMAASVSYSRELNDYTSVGITGKYISQKLDEVTGSAFAIDFGVRYQQPKYTLSAFLGNVGTKMKFESIEEKLPMVGRIGASVAPGPGYLLAAVELEKYFDGNMVVKQGLQFHYERTYFIRTGLNYYPDQPDRSIGSSLTFGAGVILKAAEFDYAFSPSDTYTNDALHRFSVVFKFNQ